MDDASSTMSSLGSSDGFDDINRSLQSIGTETHQEDRPEEVLEVEIEPYEEPEAEPESGPEAGPTAASEYHFWTHSKKVNKKGENEYRVSRVPDEE